LADKNIWQVCVMQSNIPRPPDKKIYSTHRATMRLIVPQWELLKHRATKPYIVPRWRVKSNPEKLINRVFLHHILLIFTQLQNLRAVKNTNLQALGGATRES
jgi:hypothetical protein